MIDAPDYAGCPHSHVCSSPPNRPDSNPRRGQPAGDELTCPACIWADGYYVGYDNG